MLCDSMDTPRYLSLFRLLNGCFLRSGLFRYYYYLPINLNCTKFKFFHFDCTKYNLQLHKILLKVDASNIFELIMLIVYKNYKSKESLT